MPARGWRCLGRPSREYRPTPASAGPAGLLGAGCGAALRPSLAGFLTVAPSSHVSGGGRGRPCLLAAACSDGPPALAVLPPALLDEIEAAELEGNDDRIEGVLCGAVKQLKVTRAKPDSTLYLSLMYLAKIKPNIFATEGVIEVRAGCPLLLSWDGGEGSEMGPGPLLLPPGWPPLEAHRLCPVCRVSLSWSPVPSPAGSVQPPAARRLHQLQGQGEQPRVRAGLQPPHGCVRGG